MSANYVEIPPKYFNAPGSGIDLTLFRRPRAVAALRARMFALPPTSRVRQRLLGRTFAVIWETYARGDYTTAPHVFYAPDCELRASIAGRIDQPELALGRAEVSRWTERWHEPFTDVRWRPLELFDGGDVFFFAAEMTAVGRASRAETRSPFFAAVWVEDGLVARQFMTVRRDEALEAAGFTA